MSKKTLIIIIVSFVILIAGIAGYNYIMNFGARDLNTETAAFSVTSTSISKEFASDIESANKKYLEKAVAVSGKITAIKNQEIILNDNVVCNLKSNEKSLQINQNVTLKGRIVGYDDLMGEVKLDQCVINK